jgi:hypothetical protein
MRSSITMVTTPTVTATANMPAGITQAREIQSSMMARIVRAVSPATFGGRPYRRRVGD